MSDDELYDDLRRKFVMIMSELDDGDRQFFHCNKKYNGDDEDFGQITMDIVTWRPILTVELTKNNELDTMSKFTRATVLSTVDQAITRLTEIKERLEGVS